MSGERRGRLEPEDVPSVETFSAEGIECPTIVQQSTGNVRQYIASLVAKKNKYKRMVSLFHYFHELTILLGSRGEKSIQRAVSPRD